MDEYSAEEIEDYFNRERVKAKARQRRIADVNDRHKIQAELTRERRKPFEERLSFDVQNIGHMIWVTRLYRGFARTKFHRAEAIRINRKSRRLTKAALKLGQHIDPAQYEERLPYID